MSETIVRTAVDRRPSLPFWPILSVAAPGLWLVMLAAAFAQPAPQPPTVQPPAKPPVTVPPAKTPVAEPPAKTPVAKPPVAKAKPKEAEEPRKPPEPEPITVETKDGWKIHCMYYAPMEKIRKGKQTVPIILLHGWGGQGSEWSYLATGLQTYGHAAIVPDLRGHGRSTSRKEPDGSIETVKYDDLQPQDIANMILDVEAVKGILMERNNAGELNIDMLTIIAAQEGCIIAMNWAVWDWHWPITTAGKQGQDVKALVLLSPVDSYKRMNATAALNTPVITKQLSLLFAVGDQDRKALAETSRMYSRIERIRPPLPENDPQELLRLKDCFLVKAPTTLQGTALTAKNLPVNRAIVTLIEMRLLRHRDEFPWTQR